MKNFPIKIIDFRFIFYSYTITDIFYILLFFQKFVRHEKKCMNFFARKLSFVKIRPLYVRSKFSSNE